MQTAYHRNDLPVARQLIKFRNSGFEGESEYTGQHFLQTPPECFCPCLSSFSLVQVTSCSSTQLMSLHPKGPRLYSRQSHYFCCFQLSLFSHSQPPSPPFLQLHIWLQLSSHPHLSLPVPRPCKLNFPSFNLLMLFLSLLATFTCWGP